MDWPGDATRRRRPRTGRGRTWKKVPSLRPHQEQAPADRTGGACPLRADELPACGHGLAGWPAGAAGPAEPSAAASPPRDWAGPRRRPAATCTVSAGLAGPAHRRRTTRSQNVIAQAGRGRRAPLLGALLVAALLAAAAPGQAYQLANNLIANNQPPKFVGSSGAPAAAAGQQHQPASSSEIVVRVKEGPQSVGKLICTLRAEDPDDDPLTFGVLGAMASELLRVENVPGNQANVYLKRELDRETTESHQAVITLTDGKLGRGNWITKSMLIIVEDVNDNYPVFGPHRTSISVREDARAPLVVETLEASDADEGRFGQVVYRLDELHDEAAGARPAPPLGQVFAIETVDGKGVLSLVGQLDFEQRPLYQLRVVAVDRAAEHERLSAATSILVSVEDCPDQPPMFTFAPSITRIPEDLAVGSPVVRVTAVDGDRGVNSPIKYQLLSVNNQESGPERNLFSMGADSGQVSVARELDREAPDGAGNQLARAHQPGAYVLQVQALEVAGADGEQWPDGSATTELTVILTDVNDEPPAFNQPHYFGELLENSPAESLVAFVAGPPAASQEAAAPASQQQQQHLASLARVFDRDQGRNGTFTLHLEGEHAHLFDVWPREATNEASLMLKVAPGALAKPDNLVYFDFEQTRELHLQLVAREKFPSTGGAPSRSFHASSRAKMTVYLRDANDNYPQFDSELYRVEMPENAVRGMHVCAVKASDADSGAYGNAGLRYTEIRGETANRFKLDPLTGVVTLRTNEHGFDRETVGQHHLIVEARDTGGLGNRNTTQLLIVLTDANDQRPKFLLDQYEAFIYENELDFQSPLQVQALDGDAPNSANSRLVYSIAAGDPQHNFTIDPQTGRIRVRATLLAPPAAPQNQSLAGGASESDIVILGEQQQQQQQPPQPLQATGLDFERIAQKRDDTRQFNLTVRATDAGLPEPLWGATNVIISVYDKNDHAPVFTRPVYSRTIREDAKEGSQVVQVLALDGDHSPVNSRISYRISSGSSDKFAIDAETGLISVARGANLDIDQPSGGSQRRAHYLLNVLAFDGSFGPNQKSSSCLVNITILDVNNKPPEFVSLGGAPAPLQAQRQSTGGPASAAAAAHQQHLSGASVSVSEDAPYGLIVTRVLAQDADSSAELRYSINWARSEARNEDMALVEPALFRDCLAMDPLEGTIKVAKQLDRELFDQLKLRLQVEDVAAQTADQVAQAHLLVRISDVNDNRPAFKRAAYKAVVNENSVSGTSVATLTADDRDLNKTLRYSLRAHSPAAARLVRINPKSGEITVNDKIDRELFPLINVTVEAEDQGQPQPLVGSAQLLITVRDENDNNPIFVNASSRSARQQPAPEAGAPAGSALAGDQQPRNHNNNNNNNNNSNSNNSGAPSYRSRSLAAEESPPAELALLAPGATASVREDAPVGHQIAFVRAEDADLGNNGRVTYLLDSASSAGRFRVERDSGVISVARPLDRELAARFTLIIEACDNYDLGYATGESRRAFTQVYVQVTDVNDNAPVVRTNLQAHQNNLQPAAAAPAAGAAPPETLARPEVGRGDPGARAPTYDEAMQSPGPHEMPLGECLFINEFQPLGEPILTVFATDADDPDTPNGQVSLAIINNLPQNELFGLVPAGRGAPAGAEPASSAASFRAAAELTDFGDPLEGGESRGAGRGKRSPDESPGNFYHRLGGGRQQSPASIGRALAGPQPAPEASDESAAEQPGATTTLASSAPEWPAGAGGGAPASSGGPGSQQAAQLVVLQSLKERVGNYTVLVRATDSGRPALASVRAINVCVQDVNNHAPVFVRPPALANNHSLRIMENATLGSFVTQVEATDLDYGPNGRVQYSLKPTNFIAGAHQQPTNSDWQSFRIDRFTGTITTAKQLNRQLKKYYTLRVQAQDLGKPTSLASDIDLNIVVVSSGKYQPEFETQLQSLQFTENSAPGAEWFALAPTSNLDDDPALLEAPAPATTTAAANWGPASPCYYIVDGDDHERAFQLDRYTRRLTNQRPLDRERKANYTLLVQASNDCSKPPAAAEPAPVGGGPRSRRDTSGRTPAARANSQPLAPTGQPLAAPLLGDAVARLAALDARLAADKSLLKVVVKVRDLNDNPPRFTQRVYTGGITTEADFGTVFMIAQAVDPDAEANAQVSYSIVKPIKRHLAISAASSPSLGEPAAAAAAGDAAGATLPPNLRRHKRNESGAGHRQPAAATTLAPPASTTTLQIQFPYSSNANSENVYAEGSANAANSLADELLPAASDGDDLFVINAQTGEISLNFDPQRHMKGYFEFEILARDPDNLNDSARVLIYLLRQDQRVRFVLRLAPQELRQRLNKFRSVLGNITGAIVNIDSYKYHENHDGSVDKKKTSLFLHFVKPDDNTIIDVHKVLALIDNNIEYLDELYKEFHVLSSEAAQLQLSANGALVDPIDQVRTGLVGVSSFLALILVLVIALYLNQRTRYERQLKAATVSAFGGSPLHIEPDFHSQTNLPNTNLHSQDPNPIWMSAGYTGAEQVDWLSPGGGAGGDNLVRRGHAGKARNASANQRGQPTGGNSRRKQQQQQQLASNSSPSGKLIHSGSSGVGGLDDDDDEDIDGLSSTTSGTGHSVDLSIDGVGRGASSAGAKRPAGSQQQQQLAHSYNTVATTATPRDSLASSHGQVSSAGSGSGSASTTNERQALCGRNASGASPTGKSAAASHLAAAALAHNHAHLLKKGSRGQPAAFESPLLAEQALAGGATGCSSTFGAMKEVTIYTDHPQHRTHQQHQQQQQPAYAQPVRPSGELNRLAANPQQLQHGPAAYAATNQVNRARPTQQTSVYVANIKQGAAAAAASQSGRQRLVVHANGVDVDQGIIKNLSSSLQQQQQQQLKTASPLNAKFVPASGGGGVAANQQQQDASVQNFETSLSKLSILNLETTEL